jgi:hypothetical protein
MTMPAKFKLNLSIASVGSSSSIPYRTVGITLQQLNGSQAYPSGNDAATAMFFPMLFKTGTILLRFIFVVVWKLCKKRYQIFNALIVSLLISTWPFGFSHISISLIMQIDAIQLLHDDNSRNMPVLINCLDSAW